jgi:23S rRNA-/tRNA-specific pseudouridylate synthase
MGDELYGGKRIKLNGLNRQFLHAKKIEVQLPASPDGSQGGPDKTWIEAESDLADDLKEVLVNLNSKVVKSL